MKNIFTVAIVFIIGSILLSSCNSNMSITKRHYNNGYYVEHGSTKQIQAKAQNPIKPVKNKVKQSVQTLPGYEKNTTLSDNKQVPPLSNSATVLSGKKNGKVNPLHYKRSIFGQEKITVGTESSFKKESQVENLKNLYQQTAAEDGLSLLWILILILLILWALGFISGGWGFGGLINLLLVIALVLLILWLLRVV